MVSRGIDDGSPLDGILPDPAGLPMGFQGILWDVIVRFHGFMIQCVVQGMGNSVDSVCCGARRAGPKYDIANVRTKLWIRARSGLNV